MHSALRLQDVVNNPACVLHALSNHASNHHSVTSLPFFTCPVVCCCDCVTVTVPVPVQSSSGLAGRAKSGTLERQHSVVVLQDEGEAADLYKNTHLKHG
jgi:hypothetical protein